MQIPCIYCRTYATHRLVFEKDSHPHWPLLNNIDLYECAECHSQFTYPMPTKEQLSAFYTGQLDVEAIAMIEGSRDRSQGAWYADVLKYFEFSDVEHARIADVGAGAGQLSLAISDHSSHTHLDCYDFCGDPIGSDVAFEKNGNTYAWHTADFSEWDWVQRETYDYVFCVAVIEHVTDPVGLVEKLLASCRPGGHVCLAGPMRESTAYRILGKKWPYYLPGEHLSIPSLVAMQKIGEELGSEITMLRPIPMTYSLQFATEWLLSRRIPWMPELNFRFPTGAFALKLLKA